MKAIECALMAIALCITFSVNLNGQCDKPTLLQQSFVDSDVIIAQWRPDSNATHYSVEIKALGDSTWTSDTTSSYQFNFAGLAACEHYEIRVQTVCSSGSSTWSSLEAITSDCLETPSELGVKAEATSTGTEIFLRWIPNDYESMKWGVKYGYTVTRTTLKQGDSLVSSLVGYQSKVLIDPFLVPIEDTAHWFNLSDNVNELYGVAAGALFGEDMEVQSVDSVDLMQVVNMNKAEETHYTFGLFAADSDFAIAEEMCLGYKDTNVTSGEEYLYTVSLNNIDPNKTKARNGSKIIGVGDSVQLLSLSDLHGNGGDSIAFLSWDNTKTEDIYVSFIVERSDDGGATFQPVTDDPIIYTSNANDIPGIINYSDRLPDNTNTYIFRAKGKSPYGFESPYSDTVHVKGRPAPIPVAPGLSDVEEVTTGTLDITWEFDVSYESDIQGFEVFRAPSRDSIFYPITTGFLSPSTRAFVDDDPLPISYYRVVATDVNNHKLRSLVMVGQPEDNTPPDAPASLTGYIEDNGLMTINWDPSVSSDVLGYRIYASNHETGEYTQLTSTYTKYNQFYHQIDLSMMAEFLYVGIKAVDQHENYSDMSAILPLPRPDIIPPSAPVFSYIGGEDSKVVLKWELSSSNDVEYHRLERKIMNVHGWSEIITLNASDPPVNGYEDLTTTPGVWYEYRLLAYDEADNFSSSKIVKARGIDNGIRPPIEDLTGQFFPVNTNPQVNNVRSGVPVINLNWSYSSDFPALVGFTIYRSADSTRMATFKTISLEDATRMATSFSGGRGIDCGFIDDDLFMGMNVRSSYVIPSRYNPANPGNIPRSTPGSVPVFRNINGGPTNIPPNVNVVPNPNSGNPNPIPTNLKLYYQVMAVFSDGAMSEISNFAIITF